MGEMRPDDPYLALTEDEKNEVVRSMSAEGPPPGKAKSSEPGRGGNDVRLVRYSTIQLEEVEWVWEGLIPLKCITVIEGDPGVGKSTITCAVAAAVSTGRPLAHSATSQGPGDVLMLNAEDLPGATVRKRLAANGADLDRVHHVENLHRLDDMDRLRDLVVDLEPKLLVVDPLTAYFGDRDSYRDADVRQAFGSVLEMAQARGTAVVVVRHLTKASGGRPIYRGGGSIGIAGAARSVLLVGQDGDERAVIQTKNNLAPLAAPEGFALDDGRVQWTGPSELTAERVLRADGAPGARPAREQATALLQTELEDGRKRALYLKDLAQQHGISTKSLERAGKELGVVHKRERWGPGGAWYWSLPPGQASTVATADAADGASEVAPSVEPPEVFEL